MEQLGFPVTEERRGEFFIIDAGGLRLCVDLADGEIHFPGTTDPVIGLKVRSLPATLGTLVARGINEQAVPVSTAREATPSFTTRTDYRVNRSRLRELAVCQTAIIALADHLELFHEFQR